MSPPRPSWTRTPRGRKTSRPERTAAGLPEASKLDVEAALVRAVCGEGLRIGSDVDRAVGADAGGKSEDPIGDIGGDDFAGAVATGGDDRERADRSAAGDEDALVEERAGAGDGVERHGERLGQGGDADRHVIGNLVALSGQCDEPLAEGALDVREGHGAAVEAHVEALVRKALQAVFAGAAGAARRDGDAVADGEAFGPGADSDDAPGDLVAEDHRLAQSDGAEAAVVVIV